MNLLTFKEIVLDRDLKMCFVKDAPINLTKAEYLLLEFLLLHRGKVFSRRELLNAWTKEVSLRTVDTAISRLRKKLKEYSNYIITRPGFGYGLRDLH